MRRMRWSFSSTCPSVDSPPDLYTVAFLPSIHRLPASWPLIFVAATTPWSSHIAWGPMFLQWNGKWHGTSTVVHSEYKMMWDTAYAPHVCLRSTRAHAYTNLHRQATHQRRCYPATLTMPAQESNIQCECLVTKYTQHHANDLCTQYLVACMHDTWN